MPSCSVSASLLTLTLAIPLAAAAQTKSDSLKSNFENPPASARPRVWWHWMNGNITKEGIKLDLEWMHRIGLAGFQNFDAAFATPQVVDHRLVYMTPEWKDAFKYATTLADQLGMEEAIAGSPGWSETGGPWVPPSQGMKKYVWSETVVEGGKPFTGTLVKPPSITGAFQMLGIHEMIPGPPTGKPTPQFYADSVVVAYRPAASDLPLESLHPKFTASAGAPDPAILTDGDLEKTTKLPIPKVNEAAWVQYEFSEPQTMRSLTIVTKDVNRITAMITGVSNPERSVEASDDSQNFREIARIPDNDAPEHTVSFSPVSAKFFRVVFKRLPPPPAPPWASGLDPKSFGFQITPPTDYEIAELVLHTGARVNSLAEKAAFVTTPDLYHLATPAYASADVVAESDVIDLASKVHPDGTLDWTPPPGRWVVLRFGYSLLGITNHPATPEATGLEVDKLNSTYVKNYMNGYLDSYLQTVGPELMGKRGIRYVVTDSWEAGAQNWTDDILDQFKKRRGYDPMPWLPVLTGQIVESSEASDRFLWDFRKTIADLTAEAHYGQVEASLKERGIGHYGESHEDGRAFIADGMEVKKLDEIPMSAMWVTAPGVNLEQFGYDADDRESAAVAHIYGQNIAAAESLTAASFAWAWSPATLKATADQELLNGINRFVIHESAHQPVVVDKKPGLTLGPFGQWFNRNETWAEQAGPWIDYLSRSSYLLQQGHFAADLLYFYGEDSNLTALFATKLPDLPPGYGFDYINADALIHELNVADGRITTKSGMTYRLLALDPYAVHMSLPVLRGIYRLVQQGAIVAGQKPVGTPSLADDQADFQKLNDELFGDGTGIHTVGRGKVYAGQKADAVVKALNLEPDFDFTKPENSTHLLFVHRKLADADIYFVDNRSDRTETVDASFRVTGKAPDLWHAETAKSEPASYNIAEGKTTVPLTLAPWGSIFVVFQKPSHSESRTLPKLQETQLASVEGSWDVSFEPNRGAPTTAKFDKLISWNDSPDAGVKYFSGTATYTKTINAPSDWFKHGAKVRLDLGDVKNLAEVMVNGKSLGIFWHPPYLMDVSGALKKGSNQVTIKVTNAWVNRLIGDQQPNAAKYTYADVKPYNANSPLQPSGLIGPVRVLALSKQ